MDSRDGRDQRAAHAAAGADVGIGVLAGIAMVPIAPFVLAYLMLKGDEPEWDSADDDSPDDCRNRFS